jgi:hypothetical protein
LAERAASQELAHQPPVPVVGEEMAYFPALQAAMAGLIPRHLLQVGTPIWESPAEVPERTSLAGRTAVVVVAGGGWWLTDTAPTAGAGGPLGGHSSNPGSGYGAGAGGAVGGWQDIKSDGGQGAAGCVMIEMII